MTKGPSDDPREIGSAGVGEGLFRSSGYMADGRIRSRSGVAWDLADLPAFLRVLLVADGTVTKSLEAYFWEPVLVEVVGQATCDALSGEVAQFLDVGLTNEWLLREVALRGRDSGRRFACARSWLALSALPKDLAAGIKLGGIGIGELLRQLGVETYRDIVALEFLPSGQADSLLAGESGAWIARAYRIRVGGVPAILVREYFPSTLYAEIESNMASVLTAREL